MGKISQLRGEKSGSQAFDKRKSGKYVHHRYQSFTPGLPNKKFLGITRQSQLPLQHLAVRLMVVISECKNPRIQLELQALAVRLMVVISDCKNPPIQLELQTRQHTLRETFSQRVDLRLSASSPWLWTRTHACSSYSCSACPQESRCSLGSRG